MKAPRTATLLIALLLTLNSAPQLIESANTGKSPDSKNSADLAKTLELQCGTQMPGQDGCLTCVLHILLKMRRTGEFKQQAEFNKLINRICKMRF
ncbi:hypothetical protein BOX15_Mlig009308g1 [Macrostomum lignano]|uniref:Saposin B-type domain-containing protein n=1 Tax=Macrostomum lignano TaxID=282301 RepID=A0A267HB69_9PLAT|nr:hypothetical protein BOX15_Mlig009308g1 [Macrostomum lignano]